MRRRLLAPPALTFLFRIRLQLIRRQPQRGVWRGAERHGWGRRQGEAAAAAAAGLQRQRGVSRAPLGGRWRSVSIRHIQDLGRRQSLRGARNACHQGRGLTGSSDMGCWGQARGVRQVPRPAPCGWERSCPRGAAPGCCSEGPTAASEVSATLRLLLAGPSQRQHGLRRSQPPPDLV